MAMAARNQGLPRQTAGHRRPAPVRPALAVIQGGNSGISAGRASVRVGAPPARVTGTSAASAQAGAAAPRTAGVSQARIAAGLFAMALSAVLILVLVLLNVYVAQSSFQLNELQKQVRIEQNEYRRMRYEVSMAKSPARLAEAAGRLGLLTPVQQESLEGRPPPPGPEKPAKRAPEPGLKALLAEKP